MYWGGVFRNGSSSTGTAAIFRNVGGGWALLHMSTTILGTATPIGITGTLRFEVVGTSLKLFLGTDLISMASDSMLTTGSVGIRGTAGATFDDFSTAPRAAAINPGPTFSDNFSTNNYDLSTNTQTASGTELGLSWKEQLGFYNIVAGKASTNTGLDFVTLNNVSVADVIESAAITLGNSAAAGLVARYSGPGDTNMYWGGLFRNGSSSTSTAAIYRNIGGTWVQLAGSTTILGTATTIGITGTLHFEVVGTSLKLFLGTDLISLASDSMLTTGGVGIRATAGATFDDYSTAPRAAAINPGPTFSDNFSTNNYDLSTNTQTASGVELGLSWKEQVGVYSIVAGKASTNTGLDFATLNGVSVADVVESAAITLGNSAAAGLVARYTGTGDTNMYWGGLFRNGSSATSTAAIYRNVGGTWTHLAGSSTVLGTATPIGITGTLRFEMIGTSLKLYFGSSLIAVAQDGVLTAAGSVGIRGTAGVTFDDYNTTPHAARINPGTSFTDNFATNNYNGVTNTQTPSGSELGLSWTEQVGAFTVASGAATGADGLNVATINGLSSADVEVTANATFSGAGQNIGLVARYSGSGDNNMYLGTLVSESGGTVTAQIWRNLGGVWTLLAQQAGVAYSGTFKFKVNGVTLDLIIGATDMSVTDTSITTAGTAGIRSTVGTSYTFFNV